MLSVNALLVGIKHIDLETPGQPFSCTIPVQSDRSNSRAPTSLVSNSVSQVRCKVPLTRQTPLCLGGKRQNSLSKKRHWRNCQNSIFLQSFTHSLNIFHRSQSTPSHELCVMISQQSHQKVCFSPRHSRRQSFLLVYGMHDLSVISTISIEEWVIVIPGQRSLPLNDWHDW